MVCIRMVLAAKDGSQIMSHKPLALQNHCDEANVYDAAHLNENCKLEAMRIFGFVSKNQSLESAHELVRNKFNERVHKFKEDCEGSFKAMVEYFF